MTLNKEQKLTLLGPMRNCAFIGTQEELEDHLVAHDLPPATADDGYTEEEWSDSATERERFNSITGRG